MKIAIIGYGRMGRTIATLAPGMGHEVSQVIERAGQGDWDTGMLAGCDVAIEFTTPDAAPDNILRCLGTGIPVVSGTTGWAHRFPEVAAAALRLNGAFFYASNFSIGVNLCFALNRYLALWMDAHPEYAVEVYETHHIHKKDAPSGTAITLAEGIIAGLNRKSHWAAAPAGDEDVLQVFSFREGEVPGTHEVVYRSATDTITLRHEAHSRTGFARGALLAAAWLPGRQGVFGMEDLLGT